MSQDTLLTLSRWQWEQLLSECRWRATDLHVVHNAATANWTPSVEEDGSVRHRGVCQASPSDQRQRQAPENADPLTDYRYGADVPVYTCTAPRGTLTSESKAALAAEISRIHAAINKVLTLRDRLRVAG